MNKLVFLVVAVFVSAVAAKAVPQQKTEQELIKGFLDDLTAALGSVYNEVLFPAINTQVQNVALLGAQLLAGLSVTGFGDLLGKREAKDFFSDLWNGVLFPAIDSQVQNVALLGAQLLAGLSVTGFGDLLGKRDTKGFTDFITDLGSQLYQTLLPTVDAALQSLALTGAQILAGVAVNGIGKRDEKGFLDDLTAALGSVYNEVLFPAINTQVQNVALLGAQLLAGLSVTGFGDLLGKREAKDFFTDLGNQLWASLLPTVDAALQSLALTGAQLLAGVAVSGIGKRDAKGITDFFTDLGNQLYQTLLPTVDSALQSLALTGAQLLAGIAVNGIGKRDAKGFLDDLTAALGSVYNEVLFPAINTQVQNVALLGAQLLAGLSVTGFGDLLGKRDEKGFTDFITDLGSQLYQTLLPTVDAALQSLALTGAQILAGVAVNGIGKRDTKGFTDFITDLGNQLYQTLLPTVDSALQSLALTGAQLLAGIAVNGIGK